MAISFLFYPAKKSSGCETVSWPVSLYAMIIEQNPPAMILFRSLMTSLLDKTEKILPTLTPENLKDEHPLMKPLPL